mmetsp:Transcript_34595/g.32960  ORF Transcript_34595/g.32960 Transcript_34595/m.32960 type:complete len:89 (-) Transcript_34595:609-875(-)|eukprot:CAMPEP_0119037046 /NCGR_PEP_ID=MMETSP1177-20130426/5138_1 /TAXON_ID=2985 /ORGANISM="Ochromonas sp, Strain CCMP1899" /LENGTH=88 /DNA_ID=CAMNT_0006997739 /DNA_START=50 /DNA_END=316 /DNA_ORIENTATION=-
MADKASSSAVKDAPIPPTSTNKTVLELLEEDDEFEEFEGATWEKDFGKEAEDGQLWQDDWDDDDTNDDFTQQLRQQIEATTGSMGVQN